MLKPMEKIKLSSERVRLITQLKDGSLKGMDKIRASKRVVEIVNLLGGRLKQLKYPPIDENQLTPFDETIKDKKALFNWLQQLQGKSVQTVDGKLVRFNRNKSTEHMVHDSIIENNIAAKAVTHAIETFKNGAFIEREALKKDRTDRFVAFHVYQKMFEVDEAEVLLQVKAGELDSGLLEAGDGLIAYTVKDLNKKEEKDELGHDSLQIENAEPIPHRPIQERLSGEASDTFMYDKANNDVTQDEDYVFIEILKITYHNYMPNLLQSILDSLNSGTDPQGIDLDNLFEIAKDDNQSPVLSDIFEILSQSYRQAGVALTEVIA